MLKCQRFRAAASAGWAENRGFDHFELPWSAGSATGIGSMPGTDPAEAMRVVAGELPDFPHLPELPDRGPGADLAGRIAALLVEIPVEVTPRGWRLAERDYQRGGPLRTSTPPG